MKKEKIYHFINDQDGIIEIVYSSPDRSLIEECICDSFMEDFWYEVENNLKFYDNTFEAMKEAWEGNLEYYQMYVYVGESQAI